MEKVYVTGHRNPDMDSICSAIGYSALKNLIDPKCEYIPIRCSHISEAMEENLKALGIIPPVYKRDVFPKVSDVMLTTSEILDISTPLTEYAKLYNIKSPSAVPVFKNSEFYGLLSIDDIANWTMQELLTNEKITSIPTIENIITKQETPVKADETFESAKNKLLDSGKRGLAVLDGDNFVGYITRRCFFNTPKNNVILVDHNEQEQSVQGIETANVTEIIDHHRLNAVKTDLPLFIDAEPLGSTCTIVYQLFLRNGVRPNKEIAKTLLAGIISDTLILKSPTTTSIDVESANNLATICGVEVSEFGKKMFSNVKGLKSRNAISAIESDFKIYTQKNTRIGIGQCEVTTLHDIDDYVDKYLSALEEVKRNNALNWTVLMITDVLKEKSILLSTEFLCEKSLPYTELKEHIFDMPGVMSRKKQLLPEILHVVNEEL